MLRDSHFDRDPALPLAALLRRRLLVPRNPRHGHRLPCNLPVHVLRASEACCTSAAGLEGS